MVDRIPYAFLDEVSPNMKRDLGPLLGPSISQKDNALPANKPEKDFSTEFPPDAVGKVFQYGLNQGPPMADRAFFMHNNGAPKDDRHPVMVPAGYRNKRYKYYNSPMHRDKPHFRKKFVRISASSHRPRKHNTMIGHRRGPRPRVRYAEPFESDYEGFTEDDYYPVQPMRRSKSAIWQFLTHVFMGVVLIVVIHSIMLSKYGR